MITDWIKTAIHHVQKHMPKLHLSHITATIMMAAIIPVFGLMSGTGAVASDTSYTETDLVTVTAGNVTTQRTSEPTSHIALLASQEENPFDETNLVLVDGALAPLPMTAPTPTDASAATTVQTASVTAGAATTASGSNQVFTVYTVQPGDTASTIAQHFGLKTATILAEVHFQETLRVGQQITVPLLGDGVTHQVQQGDTLDGIAQRYGISTSARIAQDNHLDANGTLRVGQILFVRGGATEAKHTASIAAPVQQTPVTRSVVTERNNGASISMLHPLHGIGRIARGISAYHTGVDLDAARGTPIYASMDGTVTKARAIGYNGGYGKHVVIADSTYLTRYAHMDRINVSAGQSVHKGDLIGWVGTTGNSTGYHLHFEVYRNGRLQNPMPYIY